MFKLSINSRAIDYDYDAAFRWHADGWRSRRQLTAGRRRPSAAYDLVKSNFESDTDLVEWRFRSRVKV